MSALGIASIIGFGSLTFFCVSLYFLQKYNIKTWSDFKKKSKMNKILYEWLKLEWKISNHAKYQKYFEEWVKNLTDNQISGFEKMRTSDNIKH